LDEEYTSNKFYELLALDKTIHQSSCTNISEQNGIAKRNIGTLSKLLVFFLLYASIPNEF
jgi:hypothetical protein